jgi:ribosomal-protein-alanine N-acetyltransferase
VTVYFLSGPRFGLRPLRPADADGPYTDWFNDAEVCRANSHHVFPYDPAQARRYIESVNGNRNALVLAIEDKVSQAHIGNVSLQDIHWTHRSAELAIVIGDRAFWGIGVGAEVGALVVRHGFEALGLHRIACGTTEDNDGMRKLAQQLGMREEGRRRRAVWKDGRWLDVIEYGILADEFTSASRTV